MPRAVPTMTPEQEAQWQREMQAGTSFGAYGSAAHGGLQTWYTLVEMVCQQCDRVFPWYPHQQASYWARARQRGRVGPPACSQSCARRQATRVQMWGTDNLVGYPPLHVIADLAYARTHEGAGPP